MMQKSVLSAVEEDRKRVMQNLGAADHARMEQYFTSVRQTELQMEAELQRPSIEANVAIPEAPAANIVQQRVAQPAGHYAADGAAGRDRARHRPDPRFQSERLGPAERDVRAGRSARLSPVDP